MLLSETDSLTGIHNRRYFIQTLETIPSMTSGVCLMIFDIDNFKAVNDQFGHATGDRVIQFVAQQAQMSLIDNQTLARIGGEEFVILAFFSSSLNAEQYAQHLVKRIAEKSIENFPEIGAITISLGVAYYPNSLEQYELSLADQALYQAKHNGKNQVITFIYSG
ncbi:GGDEF domain-containing protein [Vibrio metschnikovii]|uniref:GGDEF domain-containing protein n=1 Tax=Vibrio metschnikovii TaxID=28172 RepID=UPI001C30F0C5|nr:GGDEF domain-containing protein [Vibrio metschnikovii]